MGCWTPSVGIELRRNRCAFACCRGNVNIRTDSIDGKTAEKTVLRPRSSRWIRWCECCLPRCEKKGAKVKKEQVRDWLKEQTTYTLHKPLRRRFRKNRVIVYGIGHQWQVDPVDVQTMSFQNKGFKYLLTCIDIFSKHAWVVPLKDKKGATLVTAFQKILRGGRKPYKLQSDKGTEFTNCNFQRLLRDNDIVFFYHQQWD